MVHFYMNHVNSRQPPRVCLRRLRRLRRMSHIDTPKHSESANPSRCLFQWRTGKDPATGQQSTNMACLFGHVRSFRFHGLVQSVLSVFAWPPVLAYDPQDRKHLRALLPCLVTSCPLPAMSGTLKADHEARMGLREVRNAEFTDKSCVDPAWIRNQTSRCSRPRDAHARQPLPHARTATPRARLLGFGGLGHARASELGLNPRKPGGLSFWEGQQPSRSLGVDSLRGRTSDGRMTTDVSNMGRNVVNLGAMQRRWPERAAAKGLLSLKHIRGLSGCC